LYIATRRRSRGCLLRTLLAVREQLRNGEQDFRPVFSAAPAVASYRRRLAMQGRRALKPAPVELVRTSLAVDDRGALVWSLSPQRQSASRQESRLAAPGCAHCRVDSP
jgi:hypothetical protein